MSPPASERISSRPSHSGQAPPLLRLIPRSARSLLLHLPEQVVEVRLGQWTKLLARGIVLEAIDEALHLDPDGDRADELVDEAHVAGPLGASAGLPEHLLQVGLADAGAAQDGELPEAAAIDAGPARQHR